MHLWDLKNWEKYILHDSHNYKTGMYMRFDKDVNFCVKEFCKLFAKWVRKEFVFPIRVNVYVKSSYRIKAKDGEMVVGTFWRPESLCMNSYIRIATGDYEDLVEEIGKENAMWAILSTLAHELSHYFQYVNNISLTPKGEERQAMLYSKYILGDYAEYLELINESKNMFTQK